MDGKRRVLLVAVACGALLVSLAPPAVAAPVYETVTFIVHPPTGGSGSGTTSGTAQLTCGWHANCQTLSNGTGLDWVDYGNPGNRNVNIRATVKTSFHYNPERWVRVKRFQRIHNNCTEIVAEIWVNPKGNAGYLDWSDDIHVMNLHWMHTGNITSTAPLYFNGSFDGVTAGTKIGEMIDDACPSSGLHTHAYDTGTSHATVVRNTAHIPKAAGPCFYPYSSSTGKGDKLPCNWFQPERSSLWSPPATAAHWERKVSYKFCIANCLI
jgi:hypothetical protein